MKYTNNEMTILQSYKLFCIAIVGDSIKSKRVEFTSGDVREGTTTAVPAESISLTSPQHKMVHTIRTSHTE